MAPFPFVTSCDRFSLNPLGFEHPDPLSNRLRLRIEGAQSVGIFHAVRLGKQVEINLTERKSVIVFELWILWCFILGPRLDPLLIVRESNFSLRNVGHSLGRHNTSSLSQLAERRHFA